jgi:hypothetical protein
MSAIHTFRIVFATQSVHDGSTMPQIQLSGILFVKCPADESAAQRDLLPICGT